jgi:hydrogenase nickel incorporation protein HypA/HybF
MRRTMHEMSLTVGLLDIVREEMKKHGAQKLVLVRLRCGALANVVPEALSMAFEVLTDDTDLAGARLEMVEEPLRLACGGCGNEFSPEASAAAMFTPCPACGEEIGHRVLAGKELYIDHMEVES